ncbi:MAG: hypothetical protein L3J14_05505 [Flavobacteriaceae bacterium]|nr:hypothetical protein [Flavobacteriaceae bacterium]
MNKKRILKIFLYVIGILALLIIGILIFGYLYINTKSSINKEKYPHYVGYIDQENALLNNVYELCGKGLIHKTHHGAPDDAFEVSKKRFRETILSEYKNENYTDSGYLNFRFLVNCEGNAGWFEIIEMNLDLEEINLSDAMVNELLILTSNSKHWKILKHNKVSKNYYMYISYRIENGRIVEILP